MAMRSTLSAEPSCPLKRSASPGAVEVLSLRLGLRRPFDLRIQVCRIADRLHILDRVGANAELLVEELIGSQRK